jgi:hypothetical protein
VPGKPCIRIYLPASFLTRFWIVCSALRLPQLLSRQVQVFSWIRASVSVRSQVPSDSNQLSQEELKTLAHQELNTGQIKKVIKTATIIATGEHILLTIDHLHTALGIRNG